MIANYPKSGQVPTAYLQKGITLEAMEKPEEAIKAFDVVARKYPHRDEAKSAKERLKALRGDKDEPVPVSKPKPKPTPAPAPKKK